MTISDEDDAVPKWKISLTGEGLGAKIMIGGVTITDTRVGKQRRFVVPVRNVGNQAILEITDAAITPPDQFSLADPPWQTAQVTLISQQDFHFVFHPQQRGTATAMLTFTSNAYNEDGNTVLIEGRGLAPVLHVDLGHEYSFGTVRSGESAARIMVVGNRGDADLEIEPPRVGAGSFAVKEAAGPELSRYSVGVMSSMSFVLSFQPPEDSRGATETTLTIISDDPVAERTTYTITLRGEAVSPKIEFLFEGCDGAQSGMTCIFGEVEVGEEKFTTLTVTNAGYGEALKISSITMPRGDFSMHGASSATIAVRESSSWRLRFSPNARVKTDAKLFFHSNNPGNGISELHLEGQGIAAVITATINGVSLKDAGNRYSFGEQSVGGSTSARVVVINVGELPLQVSGISLGSTASFTREGSDAFTVETGASTTLHVSFAPPRRGAHETMLTINSNHLGGEPYEVRLAGTGTAPALAISFDGCRYATMTRTCDFGDVWADTTASATVIVGNVGEEALRVTPTVVAGVYSLAGPAQRLLAPGSTGAWTLSFSPSAVVTTYAAALVFDSNDPSASSRTVNLTGVGVGPEMVISYAGCSRTETDDIGFDDEEYHFCYFDDVSWGTTKTAQLEIANEGNRDLVIGLVQLEQFVGSFYRLDGAAAATIAAGHSARWNVSCSGLVRLRYSLSARLSITSNYRSAIPRQSLVCAIVWSGVEVSVDGRSYATGGAYDFGDVAIGTSRTVPVVVTNAGHGKALAVRSLQTSGTGFAVVGAAAATIAAGASHTWRLRFSPDDETTHAGALTIRSDDRAQGEWGLRLAGRGAVAKLVVPRPKVDFGKVAVGSTKQYIETIENHGTVPLVIESIVAAPTTFSLAASVPNEDIKRWLDGRRRMAYTVAGGTGELAPGASTTFSVAFSPHVPSDEDNAILTIRSNAPDSTVRLTGKGEGPLLLASIGADENRRYVLNATAAHDVGEFIASDGDGVTTEVKVRLQNIGNENLRVVVDLTTGSGAFRLSTDVPDPIPENNFKDIVANFTPTERGAHTATLTLSTVGNAAAAHAIHFRGSRSLPLLEVGCRSATPAKACDFGNVRAGSSQAATLIVTNNGATSLLVTPAVAGARDAYSIVNPSARSVTAGSSAAWIVRFAPPAVATTYAATITFVGNHPHAVARVNLTGVGAGPGLVVAYAGCEQTLSSCSLPDVRLGTTATVRVTIGNDGDRDLVVHSLDTTSRYNAGSPYAIEGAFPATITPGSSRTWNVHFRATRKLRFSLSRLLRVDSNYHGAVPENTLVASVVWPEITVGIGGRTVSSGGAYDFGAVGSGAAATATLTISNTGHIQALALDSVRVAGAGFSIDDASNATIAAGSSVTRNLRFSLSASRATTSAGMLTIVSDDPIQGRHTAALRGEIHPLPTFGDKMIAAQIYTVNRHITTLTLPSASGSGVLRYALTPSLPAGLELTADADARTYEISGTPTTAAAMTAYTWRVSDQYGDGELTFPITVFVDYDRDEDGLIGVANLAQLNAIRWDMNGDGVADNATHATSYAAAFPDAPSGMGCPTTGTVTGCKGYELMNDLDFNTGSSSTRSDDLYYNNGKGWEQIGNSRANSYSGVFVGNGHVISNLFIRHGSYRAGLFGYLAAAGRIQSVGLANVDIQASDWVGGLVGRSEGKISASYVTGSVMGYLYVGGLVGSNRNNGVVSACYSTALVSGDGFVGGLVGTQENPGGRIIASYATGTVNKKKASYSRGGFVSRNYGSISSSYWDTLTSGLNNGVGSDNTSGVQGKKTFELRSPTTYTGIYAAWDDYDLDGNGTPDAPWDFGTETQYPVLQYGFSSAAVALQKNSQPDISTDGSLRELRVTSAAAVMTLPNLFSGSLERGVTSYTIGVGTDVGRVTVLATASHARAAVAYSPADADPAATGHQAAIAASGNTIITMTVTAQDGSVTAYAVTVRVLRDYDGDENGLIEVRTLAQLNAIRWDMNGDGVADSVASSLSYATAFPEAAVGLGCPTTGVVTGCKGYELMNDLDFNTGDSSTRTDDLYYNDGKGWEPIGNSRANSYSGIFMGNGRMISNLFIRREDYASNGYCVGLFGYLAAAGRVQSVGLINVSVQGAWWAGGLVGSSEGKISASYVTGSVRGEHYYVGGLVGENRGSGVITACYSTAGAGARLDYTGGLVGIQESGGRIIASYATGEIYGDGGSGFVDRNNGSISSSYWDTQTSRRNRGVLHGSGSGVEGKKTFELRSPTAYAGIYAAWNVDVDGVTGNDNPWDFGTETQYPVLQYGFSSAAVALQKDSQPDISADGSLRELRVTSAAAVMTLPNLFSGSLERGVTSYTVKVGTDVERVTVSATASHAKATVAYSPADADPVAAGHQAAIAAIGTIITVTVTAQDGSVTSYAVTVRVSRDYDGDEDGLIEVRTLAQLNAIRWDMNGDGVADSVANSLSYATAFPEVATGIGCATTGAVTGCKGYELMNDLDFNTGNPRTRRDDLYYNNGEGWEQIGDSQTNSYSGVFMGNGHVISNLFIRREDSASNGYCVGLFGYLAAAGRVQSVGLINVSVRGAWWVGGLVGGSEGKISASYVTGSVRGRFRYVGGLVGENRGSGVISACYSTAGAGAFKYAGGLVGIQGSGGKIIASYATGEIYGDGGSGFVGQNRGNISSSYWNTQTSRRNRGVLRGSSSGVEGKTTAELQSPTTYTGIYAAWDDYDLDGNGTPDAPWDFGTETQYPVLRYGFSDAAVAKNNQPDISTDGSLRELRVTSAAAVMTLPNLLGSFARGVTSYTVGVGISVRRVTVLATASHAEATVAYSPADADPATAGHQVALTAGGDTTITVTVAAQDGSITNYTVVVSRMAGLYMIDAAAGDLYSVETVSATATRLGNIGVAGSRFLGFARVGRDYYSVNDTDDSLYRIDPDGVTARRIGALGVSGVDRLMGVVNGELLGVSVNSDDDDVLLSISTTNGRATRLGVLGSDRLARYIGFATVGGNVYTINNRMGTLYRVDITSRTVTSVGRLVPEFPAENPQSPLCRSYNRCFRDNLIFGDIAASGNDIFAVAIHSDVDYYHNEIGKTEYLYSINYATGAATRIGRLSDTTLDPRGLALPR